MSIGLASTIVVGFAIFFIGAIIFMHDRKSVSNILFTLISVDTVFWSISNYFSVTVSPDKSLVWIRLVLFFAAPHVILFFTFIKNFPERGLIFAKRTFRILMAVLVFSMFITISPFVFSRVDVLNGNASPQPGILMPVFALIVVATIMMSIVSLVKKLRNASKAERSQWSVMLIGVSVSYILLIFTNFVLVILNGNTKFILYGPLFMFPAILCMGYAILRHHLLNVKAIASEVLTFIILSISLFEIFVAKSTRELILRLVIFILFFAFGILLIRSVLKEVEQREKLEVLTSELEQVNEKLKVADRMKSQFLSFASHQVKSPMTVIKGYASLIGDGSYGPVSDKIREVTEKIRESSDSLIALVNNLLDLRKLDEGKVEYRFELGDIKELVQKTADMVKPLAVNKKLELKVSLPDSSIMINMDKEKMVQVVENLIDNSIKYTEHGEVNVDLKKMDSKIRITVSDSGIGIPAEIIGTLFEQFNRGSGTAKKIQGTGLGLYIAKQFVLAHQGNIWAESEGEGKGSRFIVELPINAAQKS